MVLMDRKGDISDESYFGLDLCDTIIKLIRMRIRMGILYEKI